MDANHDRFLALLATAQPGMQRFVYAHIPNYHDAEEVLQKATITLWKKFSTYREGTSFQAFAIHVARYEILHAQRAYYRRPVVLSEEMSARLGEECALTTNEDVETHARTLDGCLEKLSEEQRELLMVHYGDRVSFEEISGRVGRKAGQMRVQMFRIRTALRRCIEQALGGEHALEGAPE